MTRYCERNCVSIRLPNWHSCNQMSPKWFLTKSWNKLVSFLNNKRELPWTWNSTTESFWFWVKKKVLNSKVKYISLIIIPEICPLQAHRLPLHLLPIEELPNLLDPSTRRYNRRNWTQIANQLEFHENNWKSCYTAQVARRRMEFTEELWALLQASKNLMTSSPIQESQLDLTNTSTRRLIETSNLTTL